MGDNMQHENIWNRRQVRQSRDKIKMLIDDTTMDPIDVLRLIQKEIRFASCWIVSCNDWTQELQSIFATYMQQHHINMIDVIMKIAG